MKIKQQSTIQGKHKYKEMLHCADCFDKGMKRMWKYQGSKEYIESEKQRIEMINKLNEPYLRRLKDE